MSLQKSHIYWKNKRHNFLDILYMYWIVYKIMLDDGRYRTCARVFTAKFCWKKARKKVLISPTIMNGCSKGRDHM